MIIPLVRLHAFVKYAPTTTFGDLEPWTHFSVCPSRMHYKTWFFVRAQPGHSHISPLMLMNKLCNMQSNDLRRSVCIFCLTHIIMNFTGRHCGQQCCNAQLQIVAGNWGWHDCQNVRCQHSRPLLGKKKMLKTCLFFSIFSAFQTESEFNIQEY